MDRGFFVLDQFDVYGCFLCVSMHYTSTLEGQPRGLDLLGLVLLQNLQCW